MRVLRDFLPTVSRELWGRASLFLAWLSPALAFPLTGAPLSRPFETCAWLISCAVCFALFPSRRASSILTLAFTPCALIWAGTVLSTGAGPSSDMLMVAITSPASERAAALSTLAPHALQAFVTGCSVVALAVWSFLVNRKTRAPASESTKALFLISLVVSSLSASGMAFPAPGYEVRSSVPALSASGMLVEAGGMAATWAATGKLSLDLEERDARAAKKEFSALPGTTVLVIGESLRADHLVRAGRGRWSDALQARLDAGLGARASDACAGGNATFVSVPLLVTAQNPWDKNDPQAPTVLARLKAAGARTAWIGNQEDSVVREKGHDANIKTAAPSGSRSLDESAVESMEDWLKKQKGSSPVGAVLHLYGQHFNYEERYDRGLFPAEPAGLSSDELTELRYDRASEYGVKVLLDAAAVLDKSNEPGVLIFTSDHGENLPSDKTGMRLHANAVKSRAETRVPVLVLWNRAFAESGRVESLRPLLDARGLIPHSAVGTAFLAAAGYPKGFSVKPLAERLPDGSPRCDLLAK